MESLSDEKVIELVKENCENVVILRYKSDKFEKAIRGDRLFTVGCCMGKMTITEDGEWNHSLMGSAPTYNKKELIEKIDKIHQELKLHEEGLKLLLL